MMTTTAKTPIIKTPFDQETKEMDSANIMYLFVESNVMG
jgi:hypothetical protein